MKVLTLVSLLGLMAHVLALPLFEVIFGAILLTPVIFQLAGLVTPAPGAMVYLAIMAGLIAFAALIIRLTPGVPKQRSLAQEIGPLLAFFCAFSFFRFLTHLWPDFIAIGERLRDYALLSSVIDSPIHLREPWLAGHPLNYYAYWYQLGSMFASVLHMPKWEVYHDLQSLTYGLYFTCIYKLFSSSTRWGWAPSLLATIFITIGSNVSGLVFWLKGDDNWWGPSRVIAGAIDEFPAWSFLLGDLHPHYVNLPLVPFFCVLTLRIVTSAIPTADKALGCLCLAAISPLWIYTGNAWEIPAWALLVASLAGFALLLSKRPAFRPQLPNWRQVLVLAFTGAVVYSLYKSAAQITPGDYGWTLVKDPIKRTQLSEMGMHFGAPLFLIAACLFATVNANFMWVVTVAVLFSVLFFTDVLPLLLVLFAINLWRLFQEIRSHERTEGPPWSRVLFESFGLVSMVLVLFCEFAFLDDPYGGEIERMNTIFKFYTAAWMPLHAFAFYLLGMTLAPVANRDWFRIGAPPVAVGVTCCFLLFFFHTARLRSSPAPKIFPADQGLTSVDQQFPGSADTIKALLAQPKGITLEAQGRPYDYTTHVATLSGQPSYLGWANHVNLLTRAYGEINRREKVSEEIYTASDCVRKLDLIRQDNIKYIVLGPLEKAKHPTVDPQTFACLKSLGEYNQFRLYTTY